MPRRSVLSRALVPVAAASALALGLLGASSPGAAAADPGSGSAAGGLAPRHSLRAPVTDENFYFVMADRFANGSTANDDGGLGSDSLVSGFDPTKKGFYNGGDLIGLRGRLDYIKGLGTTSIWLTPSFKNKAVQLEDGPSAGYHGYWITDFTQIDPHLGSNADLRALVDAAHAKGMKVYFDIITNHTADVIGYTQSARAPYVSKDRVPYRTASGRPFDDRDYAGTGTFPALSPTTSFPYVPVLDPSERSLKQPAWLNDVTLYHNRGDTTFVGENSQYGDFFGLDDLFTEHPRVVRGMIDIYTAWIRNFGIDGFRIDTMKHVDDAFWQRFGPAVLRAAREAGKPEFFMFGEVFDTSKSYTSHFTTTDKQQAVLDFPFQDAARNFASKGGPADALSAFFADDDWYTDANSNVYSLPTFLGNHDMGRIGFFVGSDNPGAAEQELVARDLLAHQLMYLSRGNPVVYYGDEQGFTGTGGDQVARQSMFASRVPEYLDDDLLGTTRTHAQDNFEPGHPLYRAIGQLAALTRQHPALRDGAHQSRYADGGEGVYAFSRIDRKRQREYVVALNNSETERTVDVPTYVADGDFSRLYGDGAAFLRSGATGALAVTVPPLSAVVYLAGERIPTSTRAPAITLGAPQPAPESRGRMHVTADVAGDSFYEVTFYAKTGDGRWRSIGTDDTAPYQVFHDVSALRPGTDVAYRAVVLDNGGHSRTSNARATEAPEPTLALETPREGSKVRGTVEVRAVPDPEHSYDVVSFARRVGTGAWTPIGRDTSSPVYTVFDDVDALGLAEGTPISYRATLRLPGGGTVTATRTVEMAGPPPTTAVLRYFRPAGDYDDWGLHLWGDAIADGVATDWGAPRQRARVEDGWAVYEIPLKDASKPVNFIVHRPGGDSVPSTREPGGDRSFVPQDDPAVWVKQGDPTVYTSEPPTP